MKISELKKDDRNFNKHTESGMGLLRKSLKDLGAGRSILIDNNGKIIAGNGVAEAAEDLGIEDVIVVPTDGKKIVAVKRVDIDINSKTGRELALADNSVAENNLCWDNEKLEQASKDYGIEPEGWGLLPTFGSKDELPEELQGTDLTADEIEKITGDGSTDYKRVVIEYEDNDSPWLAELLGLECIDKVVYNIDELA